MRSRFRRIREKEEVILHSHDDRDMEIFSMYMGFVKYKNMFHMVFPASVEIYAT